jgi:hypothetical protein
MGLLCGSDFKPGKPRESGHSLKALAKTSLAVLSMDTKSIVIKGEYPYGYTIGPGILGRKIRT